MNADQVLREQLLAQLREGHAHLSFDEAIADFPHDHMNTHPPHVPYTPWHLLEHLCITQWDILEFIRNPAHVSPAWPERYWPAQDQQTDASGWNTTSTAFQQDRQALQTLVTDPATDPTAPLPHEPK